VAISQRGHPPDLRRSRIVRRDEIAGDRRWLARVGVAAKLDRRHVRGRCTASFTRIINRARGLSPARGVVEHDFLPAERCGRRDISAVEITRLFEYLQDSNTPNQYLIIGAGPHCATHSDEKGFADLTFGDLHVGDVRYGGKDRGYADLYFEWFDHWVNGAQNQVTQMPKVQLYVMGRGWISSDRWPLKEARPTKYYLSRESNSPGARVQSGVLLPHQAERDEKDSYHHDPAVPVPNLGGGCCSAAAYDQRPVEARRDVLVYSTPPLEKPVTIAGSIEVVLYVSSSAKDTDFMVRLVDVYPDGKAINLSDDAFRVRYREGFDKKVLMRPGEVYPIRLTNMVTAVQFAKGHRIRLDISSSSFPEYERNLNTGGDNYNETKWVIAENSIHHGSRYPSHIVLPVLPDER
jgi:uncharacterized protein